MNIRLFQIDAFASKLFQGNPAAVCPLDNWLDEDLMQAIANENNLSETAFIVPDQEDYAIRWFTPTAEVDLCGHATLASAYVVFQHLQPNRDQVVFTSKSGPLSVLRQGDWLAMNFPSQRPSPCQIPELLARAFNNPDLPCLKSMDYILIFPDEDSLRHAQADMSLLKQLDLRGVCITSTSHDYDFVSRCFAPKYGIEEDPVTGSSFCELIPYWASKLGKTEMKAKQVSLRGGEVDCKMLGDRVSIAGQAVQYMETSITL